MHTPLNQKHCVPCEGGESPLSSKEITNYKKQISNEWEIVPPSSGQSRKLHKRFKFKNFVEAMKFVNKIADLAESEGHHPVFKVNYNKVDIDLWTHAIGGLHANDFILAAKIEEIVNS